MTLDEVVRIISVLLLSTTVITGERPMERPKTGHEGGSRSSIENRPKAVQVRGDWKYDREISWYGPRFYGNRTACGLRLTTELVGVAHRTLPCGTLVEFRWKDKVVTAPVIDRGPYVEGRQWDLTRAACKVIRHCWTGPIWWRILNR